jgi:hypothetical protein
MAISSFRLILAAIVFCLGVTGYVFMTWKLHEHVRKGNGGSVGEIEEATKKDIEAVRKIRLQWACLFFVFTVVCLM